ncbi:MAG TPA: lyase family protein, partial [Solirubrobacteraceae bacterium]
RDALIETSGALKVVAASLTKIANDLRWMGSGPRAGLGELILPELQKGSSIMPGKVNPVICEVVTQVAAQVIGNDTAITIGGMSGAFELNVYIPLMARNLLESIQLLAAAGRLLARKARSFENVVKAGRTHLMDAVPVTLGQEFSGYAAQVALGIERVQSALVHVGQIPLGGTATGTGLNTDPRFAEKVRARLRRESHLKQIAAPRDPFEAQANRDALVELSGALKVLAVSLTKIAGDLALMGSGPRAGIGELFLPELQKGSSIMPGKVNPVIPEVVLQVSAQVIGNDTAITVGGMQGQFELNVRIPLIARNLLQSLKLLSSTSVVFAEKCVDGIQANRPGTDGSAGATLAVATALNGAIGYDKGTAIVQKATASGRPLREVALEEGVDAKLYDETIDLRKIARGNKG